MPRTVRVLLLVLAGLGLLAVVGSCAGPREVWAAVREAGAGSVALVVLLLLSIPAATRTRRRGGTGPSTGPAT